MLVPSSVCARAPASTFQFRPTRPPGGTHVQQETQKPTDSTEASHNVVRWYVPAVK